MAILSGQKFSSENTICSVPVSGSIWSLPDPQLHRLPSSQLEQGQLQSSVQDLDHHGRVDRRARFGRSHPLRKGLNFFIQYYHRQLLFCRELDL